MCRKQYKLKLLNSNVEGVVLIRDEDELSYNLKGIAESEFMNNKDFKNEYQNSSERFSFLLSKQEEEWEDNIYKVSVYDKYRQKTVETYRFKVEIYDKVDYKENITLTDYRARQKRIFDNKVAHGFNTTNVYQEARYILEEVAELMRAVEKEDNENILEELADIVIFSYGCAAVAGVGDLDTKIFEKMKINENRVYTQNSEGDFIKKN